MYREVLSRLDVIEERLDQMEVRFEKRFEQIDQRFESMEERFDQRMAGMKEGFDQRLEGVDARLGQMNDRILSMTRWLIGLIALFGTLVTALLAVAQYSG